MEFGRQVDWELGTQVRQVGTVHGCGRNSSQVPRQVQEVGRDRQGDRYNEINSISSDTCRNIWVQLWLHSTPYGSEMCVQKSRQEKTGNILIHRGFWYGCQESLCETVRSVNATGHPDTGISVTRETGTRVQKGYYQSPVGRHERPSTDKERTSELRNGHLTRLL